MLSDLTEGLPSGLGTGLKIVVIIRSASAAFLFFTVLFLNKQERQAAIGALSVIGSHGEAQAGHLPCLASS